MVIDKLFSLSVPQFLHLWNGFSWRSEWDKVHQVFRWRLAHSVRNYYIPFILNFWVNLEFKIKFVLWKSQLAFISRWSSRWIKEHRDTSDVFVALLVLTPLPKNPPPFVAHKTTTYSPLPQGRGLLLYLCPSNRTHLFLLLICKFSVVFNKRFFRGKVKVRGISFKLGSLRTNTEP